MSYELERLVDEGTTGWPTAEEMTRRVGRLLTMERARYARLWAYYANPMRVCPADVDQRGSDRPYRQGQEWGLPSRITGVLPGRLDGASQRIDGVLRKEVVIENDIGWRVDTGVDYLFGRPLAIRSTAPDPARAATITRLLEAILAHNGGVTFLQQLALTSSVYGFVDVLVKLNQPNAGPAAPTMEGTSAVADSEDDPAGAGASNCSPEAVLTSLARSVRLEIVEPTRALPFLSSDDWRVIHGYAQGYQVMRGESTRAEEPAGESSWRSILRRSARLLTGRPRATEREPSSVTVVEVITAHRWQRYEDERLVAQGDNALGQLPLVHIQNTAVPFAYAGTSDVEPLIGLQDELNTRLSDRANRIALQSFKMYLGKGVEHFNDMPVAPGRMWATDNEQADVIEFGGDANCPSEVAHIQDVREAMDKVSSVTPIAAGAIKGRIGRLTSAAALRITLLSLLSKTEKKRTSHGQGLARMLELSLAWLDRAGLFATGPDERGVELNWSSPLPQNDIEKLQEAQMKAALGVAKEVVLAELGY